MGHTINSAPSRGAPWPQTPCGAIGEAIATVRKDETTMINHRRWVALLLCAVMTFSSATVLAVDSETQAPTDVSATEPGTPDSTLEDAEGGQPAATADGEPIDEEPAEEPEPEAPAEQPAPAEDPNLIKIMLNGQRVPLTTAPVIIAGNTYLSLREFCEALGCQVTWSPSGLTTVTRGDELHAEFQASSDLVVANGRFFYMPDTCRVLGGTLMVPIRGLAKIFTLEAGWDPAIMTVSLSGGAVLENADSFYNADDLMWLARIIHAESRGEPLEGKIAVGNVVINRTKAPQYPDTIEGVIFDKKNGTQFTPAKTGSVYNTPSEECVLAAKLCLEGHEEAPGALYFLSSKTRSGWIVKNRTLVVNIGSHNFFS